VKYEFQVVYTRLIGSHSKYDKIKGYEQKHYRIDPPDPIEAIKFRMEQFDLKPSDLADILGGRNRVSEILKPAPD
jgi:antitoxin component HigA of HigAB toxin-antitoxin module